MNIFWNSLLLVISIAVVLFCLGIFIKCLIDTIKEIFSCYYQVKECNFYANCCGNEGNETQSKQFFGLAKSFKELIFINVITILFILFGIAFDFVTLYNLFGLFLKLFV